MKARDRGLLLLALLLLMDCFAWSQVLAWPRSGDEIYSLDVGQGDSTLLALAEGVLVLTDAGPDGRVVRSLDRVLPAGGRYIDLAVITHPELDHFNGFSQILETFQVGAFIFNGRDHPGSKEWAELKAKIAARKIPLLILGAGDSILHGQERIDILSPDRALLGSAALNDTGIVEKVSTPTFTALLTADIGANVEKHLMERYDRALSADILKVGHHGSKYSSSPEFLKMVRAKLALISSGARNHYGHPSPEVLGRLSAAGASVLRTDLHGTIGLQRQGEKLKVVSEK